jgi:CRISPR-associated endonuclease Csn1
MEIQVAVPYVLGIDLGANSVGWAALLHEHGESVGILDLGVRIFAAGVTGLEAGRDESHAAARRVARLQRRQTDRRRRRIHKIYGILADYGLLPAKATPADRAKALSALDNELSARYGAHDNLPYVLRARALGEALSPFELGRALFHLAQRRGFLSNRKSTKEPDDEKGKVKSGITILAHAIAESGSRTLGEHLSRLDPHEARIRGRYTSRQMYLDEFDKIWESQAANHPELLNPERKRELLQAMFHQRPLRDQSDLIGDCELEEGEKRAPAWHPLAQRFRLLQEVNHLRLIDPAGVSRALSAEERQAVVPLLEKGDLPIRELRKLLEIKRNVEINLDRGGKKALIGDRTEEKMRGAFGAAWDALSQEEKLEAITDLAGDLGDTQLARKAQDRWGLSAEQAERYSSTSLEVGRYLGFSLKAIAKMLPLLESGADATTARDAAYPAGTFRTDLLGALPPVAERLKDLRNPAVLRSLTELRKVVNALIGRYGKPLEIHVELARDLKASRPEREDRWARMRRNEKARAEAAAKIQSEIGIHTPGRADTEKWLLAEECHWRCPYSGRGFSATQLYQSGEIQVEHIIPFSRSLDDSFANKTLAYSWVNKAKGNRSPREAFQEQSQWEAILTEVGSFHGPYAKHKLQRFQWTSEQIAELLDDFTKRQLNDTRYASKLAARYMACLYGGLSDSCGQRIFVSPGQVTAFLRRLWAIEGLLSGGGGKSRDDHRHHAIDAVVVALTGPAWVKALSDAASRAREEGRRRFASLEAPWPGFAAAVQDRLQGLTVSHRANLKVGGAMHDETFYGVIQHPALGPTAVCRKLVHRLSKEDLEHIVDPRVRERVALQLGLQGGDFKQLEAHPPTIPTHDGREVPIRKVRIMKAEHTRRIGQGARARNVMGDDYHHLEVIRQTDPRTGKTKWALAAVTCQQAMERVRDHKPLVSRDHGPHAEFVCSVAKDDTLEINEAGNKRLVVVKALEAGRNVVGFKDLRDARPYSATTKNRERVAVARLMDALKCRKVTVSPLGETHYAND